MHPKYHALFLTLLDIASAAPALRWKWPTWPSPPTPWEATTLEWTPGRTRPGHETTFTTAVTTRSLVASDTPTTNTPTAGTPTAGTPTASTPTSSAFETSTSALSTFTSVTSVSITSTSVVSGSSTSASVTSPSVTPSTLTTTTPASTTNSPSSAPVPTTPSSPTQGAKRGVAFNDASVTSEFGGSEVSWSYNWASDPDDSGSYNDALIFVPMLWNADTALTSIWKENVANAQSQYGADSVLAFNEPDGCCASCGQSCIGVPTAVSAYKQWIQPLSGSLRLGAPAVTNGVGAGIGADYMQQFLASCDGCTIDFIPIHWYGDVSDPGSFKTYVEDFNQQFGKPIWITEFGTNTGTEEQIIDFLGEVLPWLDQQAYVERYAYFMARAAGSPFLLETDGSLSGIGKLYDS